jgi:hypothetical protein
VNYVRVEVNVAAAMVDDADHIIGNNMVDATIAFGWRMTPPPEGVSDEAINKALAQQLGPVLALVKGALVFNGWVAMGDVDDGDEMADHSHATGQTVKTPPVTLRVTVLDESEVIHD